MLSSFLIGSYVHVYSFIYIICESIAYFIARLMLLVCCPDEYGTKGKNGNRKVIIGVAGPAISDPAYEV